mmetsp:Transcript_76353/g.223906  ORF Transcript_76353/g.223906 Transcript_76353/m.223906 type:complete len:370 (-) Transcript_76353:442-1551(-)
MDDDELEYTLLNKRDVLVYQIPPASSSAGHKADDWKKCIWRGRCRIAGKGHDLMIKMIDASSGQLFAQCTIPNGQYENYVERAIDSSRYFVLKITNGQRHAFIGLGFEERNDAFDFNCTLSDFKSTWIDREKEVELPESQEPSKDLSLKEGQKITISLKGMEGRTRRQQTTEAAGGGFTGILAPPPPSSGQSRRQQPNIQQPAPQQPAGIPAAPPVGQPVGQQHAAAAPAAPQEDLFGDFADFQSASSGAPPGADAAPYTAAPAGLPAQFEQLNLGNAPSQPPTKSPSPQASPTHLHQPVPPQMSPATPADPFSGMGLLGDGSSKQSGTMPGTVASRPPAPMQFDRVQKGPPPRAAGGADPFDEFDIFK